MTNELNDKLQMKLRAEQEDPLVMYLIVRSDLNMSIGKTAAQVGHAVQRLMQQYLILYCDDTCETDENKFELFKDWLKESCRKVVLKANEQKWNKLVERYGTSDYAVVVCDAGLTEIEPNTNTVIGFWPMKRSQAPNPIKKLQTL